LTILIETCVALLLSFIVWELLRASYKTSKPHSELSVIVDLSAGVVAVAVLVVWLEIVLKLAF
jgi:hypothetical protein